MTCQHAALITGMNCRKSVLDCNLRMSNVLLSAEINGKRKRYKSLAIYLAHNSVIFVSLRPGHVCWTVEEACAANHICGPNSPEDRFHE